MVALSAGRTTRRECAESPAAIEEFLNRVPSDTAVLIDEALRGVRLSRASDGRGQPPVRRFPNLVVMRTFSKAYGLAGLRIGYAFGSRDLADKLAHAATFGGASTTSLVAVAALVPGGIKLRQLNQVDHQERRNLQDAVAGNGHRKNNESALIYLACRRPGCAGVGSTTRACGLPLLRRRCAHHDRRPVVDWRS